MGNHPIFSLLLPAEFLGFYVVEMETWLERKKSEGGEGNKVKKKKKAVGLWTLKVFEQRVGIGDFRYRSGWVGYGSYGEAKKEGNNFKRHGNRLGT